jgi:hypothetical protein
VEADMSVSGAYDDGFEVPPRESALLCWPVEFPFQTNPVPAAHCSTLYWPEIDASKEELLLLLRAVKAPNFYRIADVTGVAAFGEAEDYPVLTIQSNVDGQTWRWSLGGTRDALYVEMIRYGLGPDNRFTYKPHVSVDVKTLVNPPKRLILRPLELWYKDDEPVVL